MKPQPFRLPVITGLLTLASLLMALTGCNKNSDPVELTFISWRIDDVDEMNRINDLFTNAHPNVTVRFNSIDPLQFNQVNETSLAGGTGADIIFLWPFDKGRILHEAGYLYSLNSVISNLSAYDAVPRNAWTSAGGDTYGLPSVGVTHGIYYNKAIFAAHQIAEPSTWDAFIAVCDKLKAAGVTVFAQGLADNNWVLNRVIFCGLGPNFYGGETARLALMAGTAKLTNTDFVEAFRRILSLKSYLPADYMTLGYEASKVRFANGQAAMFIGGSWEISIFEDLGAGSDKIGWFAPPLKSAGSRLQYCYQVDAAIGVNKHSKNLDAALDYVRWAATDEYAEAFMSELPGFFSYTPGNHTLTNPLAQEMFDAAANADLTVRLMDQKFNATMPGGDIWLSDALEKMLLGEFTPEQAAAYVQQKIDQ